MVVGRIGRALLCVTAAWIWAGAASAVPQTFAFLSGSAHVTANVIGDPTLLVDTVVALDGTFFEFDTAPVSVPDFEISIATTAQIPLSMEYGGYDSFVIESALLIPGAGFSSAGILVGGSQYSVTLGPLDVNAFYSAYDSTNTNAPVYNLPISFSNPSLNATVDTNLVTFTMMGVTLGIFPGTLVGEPADLIVKGDITFIGTLIPEPTTGLLVGMGLVGLALRRSRSSRLSGCRG